MSKVRQLNLALVGATHQGDKALEAYIRRLRKECLIAALDAGHAPCSIPTAVVDRVVRSSDPGPDESCKALKGELLAISLL